MNNDVFSDPTVTTFAFSEGALIPLRTKGPLEQGQKIRLQQRFNILRSLQNDELGRHRSDSSNFPDGHKVSPFRVRFWKIVDRDEAQKLSSEVTEDEKKNWAKVQAADDDRRRQYQTESARWFEAMGRYVTSHENLTFEIIRLTKAILRRGGLTSSDLQNVIIADSSTTNLLKLTQALYGQISGIDESDAPVVKDIFKRANACIDGRNGVVHSSWLPGGLMPMIHKRFELALGKKLKRNDGSWQQRSYSIASLDWLRARCESTSILVGDFKECIRHGRRLGVHLTLGSDGTMKRDLDFTSTTGERIVEEHVPVLADPPSDFDGEWADPDGGAGGDAGAMRLDQEEVTEWVAAAFGPKKKQK